MTYEIIRNGEKIYLTNEEIAAICDAKEREVLQEDIRYLKEEIDHDDTEAAFANLTETQIEKAAELAPRFREKNEPYWDAYWAIIEDAIKKVLEEEQEEWHQKKVPSTKFDLGTKIIELTDIELFCLKCELENIGMKQDIGQRWDDLIADGEIPEGITPDIDRVLEIAESRQTGDFTYNDAYWRTIEDAIEEYLEEVQNA